ncbi:MAG TPA: glycosyltransferase family 2 protein [Nocardioides sp.]|uniref:glycosyltransferase family 2 protein n=1 Tax=Nocardioides sp. TaxID=35761 RepID=UPI002E312E67|nr:glycosyltransferase family 2 protein [Nocardioides sp.]HEX3930452.1 glycosyltransferase family 2 protein [Nocardioides sp.]
MHPAVVALVVSHDGARWLPAVIDGLRSQTVPVRQVVAVDTGSRDESVDLLLDAFEEVVTLTGRAGYPEAVRTGLAQVAPEDAEWIWLLHDDSNPAPDALERLLAVATVGHRADHGADVLGPKLREWPSLRRLLEVGVTISATGRRETGLEPGEYDQGQHDDVREVLAVNTAGMLVRRRVLDDLGGFDENLPIFGNDIDFGWRAAAHGYRTVAVPDAVVFHAEAAHRGTRRTPLTGRHTHYQERRAALYTLLVNAPVRALPWQVVRLFFGTLVRMAGFLVVRSAGEALDDLAALFSVYLSPGELRRGRATRRAARTDGGPASDPRPLLAPWWLPYRHGLDVVGDIVNAASTQAQDVADRRRAAKETVAPVSTRRPAVVDDETPEDTGLVARFFTNPLALALTVVVVLAIVGAREAFGHVTGGGLAPAPEHATQLLGLWTESWHPLATGTAVPAPAYVAVLGVLGWLLRDSGAAAVSAVLLLAVPLGLWGAWRMLRVVGRLVDPGGSPRWLVALGAVTYALVPVTSGAFGDGRLGLVAVAAILPFLAHAALGFGDPESERRWRAAWRTGLLLAIAAAFEPVAWAFALVLSVVVLGLAAAVTRRLPRGREVLGPPLVTLGVAPVVLLPWWLPAIAHHAWSLLLMESGRQPYPSLGSTDLLVGRLGPGVGGPGWLGAMLVVLAALAVVPRATRIPVLVAWLVGAVAAITATGLSAVRLPLPGGSVAPGIAVLLLVLHGCFVLAAMLGAQGLVSILRRSRREHHEVLLVGLALVAAVIPAVGLGWFVWQGPGDLANGESTGIPPFMTDEATSASANGILVIRGDVAQGLTYTVRRGAGDTLGESEILYAAAPDPGFDADVRALVSRPTPTVVHGLAEAGIRYLVLPAPYDGSVAAGLDATDGLGQAGTESQSTRTWQVETPVDPRAVAGPGSLLRTVLLLVGTAGLVVVLVLTLPTLRARRSSDEDES